jgi:hypothetical protein
MSISHYIASNGTMTDDQWIRKDLAGNDLGLIEEISEHFLAVSSKTTENLNEYSQCPSRDSKREPPKYSSRASTLFCNEVQRFNAFDMSLTAYYFHVLNWLHCFDNVEYQKQLTGFWEDQ